MLTDAILHRALRSGEQVRWTGEPRSALLADRRDKVFVPVSLVLLLVTGWLLLSAVIDGGLIDMFFTAPWFVLALYASIGRLVVRLDSRRRTTFAVTNLRVMAVVDGTTLRARSIGLHAISAIDVIEDDAHELSTVRFAPTSKFVAFLEATGLAPLGALGPPVAFVDVEHADRIPALIPNAVVTTRSTRPSDSATHAPSTASLRLDDDDLDLTQDGATGAMPTDPDELAARFDLLRKPRVS